MCSDTLKAMYLSKQLSSKWILSYGLPFLAIILLIVVVDFEKLTNLLISLPISTILLIGVISLIRPILGGLRCWFAYKSIGNLSILDATKGYVLSAYGTIFIPSAIGGDLLRIEHMKNCSGNSRKEALLVASLERSVGFFCLLLLAFIISFFDLPFSVPTSWFLYVFLIILGIVSLTGFLIIYTKNSLFVKMVEYIKNYTTPPLLFGVLILSLIFQCVSLSIPVIVGYVLADWDVAITIALMTPLVAIFSTLPISIGGIGLREASYVGLCALVGIENELAFLVGLSLSLSIILSGVPGILFQNELFEIQKSVPQEKGEELIA
tara:strand:- start:321 stop:1286 length:966 start_codon:yes stop_codon:yes gene_type:complete